MIRLSFEVSKEGDALDRMARKLRYLHTQMREAGNYMERETKLNFARQSDPDGKPWAGLKPSTLRRKKPRSILRETSTLVGGIALTEVSRTRAVVAATAGSQYGIYHQTGTSKMAQRKFIGIGDRHIPKIRQIFESYLNS